MNGKGLALAGALFMAGCDGHDVDKSHPPDKIVTSEDRKELDAVIECQRKLLHWIDPEQLFDQPKSLLDQDLVKHPKLYGNFVTSFGEVCVLATEQDEANFNEFCLLPDMLTYSVIENRAQQDVDWANVTSRREDFTKTGELISLFGERNNLIEAWIRNTGSYGHPTCNKSFK